jgi:hypothetical protein
VLECAGKLGLCGESDEKFDIEIFFPKIERAEEIFKKKPLYNSTRNEMAQLILYRCFN